MGKRYNRIKRLVKEDRTPYTGKRDLEGGWRKKILSESDWTPVAGSIANSTSQPFVHPTGATTTVSGLGGVETTPSTVTIDAFGDRFDVPAPEYGQYGMQGYAKPLSKEVMKRNAAYEKELEEFRKKQDGQMDKIKSTLINLGTSWEELRANGWALIRDDGTSVMIYPTSSNADMFNWTDNVEIKVGRPDPEADGKPYKTVEKDARKNAAGSRLTDTIIHNSKAVKTIKLEIGEPPKRPSVNSQLDASQEFAQEVGADEFMNARVQGIEDMPDTPTFADTDPDAPTDPNAVTPEDEAFIDYMERYPNLVNFLLPGQAAAATSVIDYARGNYRDITQSPGRSANQSILNIISRIHKPGERGGAATAGLNPGQTPSDNNMDKAYPHGPLNSPMRNFLNQFNYEVTSDGVRIKDRFNFNPNRNTGFIGNIPIKGPDGRMVSIDSVAKRLAAIGDKRARSMGLNPDDDAFGAKIDFTIPWSQVSPELQNKLDPTQTISPIVKRNRRGRVNQSPNRRQISQVNPFTGPTHLTKDGKKIVKQAGKQVVKQAGKQAGKQIVKQAGKRVTESTTWSRINKYR